MLALRVLLPAVVMVIALGCVSGDYHMNYIEEHAGFTFPRGTKNVEHFTDSDLAFTSHFTVPLDSVYTFAGEAGLSVEKPCRWDPVLFLEELPSPWDSIPAEGSFLYGSGSSGWNSWDIILNAESGDMWVTMYYTDASGDPPGN